METRIHAVSNHVNVLETLVVLRPRYTARLSEVRSQAGCPAHTKEYSIGRIICLILFTLILAACGDAKESTEPSLPDGLKLTVVGKQHSGHSGTRLEVRLPRRISVAELRRTVDYLHHQYSDGRLHTQVFFYLPQGSIGDEPAWAQASAPDGQVSIIGLTPEQESSLRALPPPKGRVVGSWLDDGPPGRRMSVVRHGSKLYEFREFETGANEYELREGKAEVGETMRLHYRDPDRVRRGEYLVIRSTGELEGFDKDGRVFGAGHIHGTDTLK